MRTGKNNNYLMLLLLALNVLLLFLLFSGNGGKTTGNSYYQVEFPVDLTPDGMSTTIPVTSPVNITFTNPMPTNLSDSMKLILFDSIARLNDSLSAIRDYEMPIEDSIITGTLYGKTKGYLLNAHIDYKVKPFTLRDSFPIPRYVKFYGLGTINSSVRPALGLGVENNNWQYQVQYEPPILGSIPTLSITLGRKLFQIKKRDGNSKSNRRVR